MTEKAATSPEKCFEAVAVAWHKTNKKWSADYADRILASTGNHIFPAIGHLPVTLLKTQHFTALPRVIEDKGFLEVVSRTRQQLNIIMRYAVQQGLTESNPAQYLDGVTAPPVKNHYPALPPERLPELPDRIADYQQGRQLTRLAILLTLHLFIRASELRFAAGARLIFKTKSGLFPLPAKHSAKCATPGNNSCIVCPFLD